MALKFTLIVALMVSSAFAGEFLPLKDGNIWVYRETVTGQSFAVRVGTPFFINNKVYYSLTGYVQQKLLVRMDENNALVYLDEERGAEIPLSVFEPYEGIWWNAGFRQCEQEGQALAKRVDHDGPAGPFLNVLEVRYRVFSCADAGVETEQYAENIGMVRRVANSFAGPRKFDLVYARVGNAVIQAAAHGRFTVNVDSVPAPASVPVTLRMETTAPLKLTFPTGQEYEVVVRDAAGREVWKWSDGWFFTQAVHELEISTEWTVQLHIPRHVIPQNGTVQAWMTTPEPSFSARTALPALQ